MDHICSLGGKCLFPAQRGKVVRSGCVVMDGEVNVEETGYSLLQVIGEGRLSEIFISVTFPSQPAIHNLARDWKTISCSVSFGIIALLFTVTFHSIEYRI
jgi:hypothetical protein